MGRGALIVVVLAACAPHVVREPLPAGPERVTLDGGEARVRGELRAGDDGAWYAIEVPTTIECPRVEVELRPREHGAALQLAVALYDHERHPIAAGHARAAISSNGQGGRYFAKVYARDASAAAGAFVLDVRAAQYGCDELPDPPTVVHRPPGYQPPAIAPSIDHEVAGVLSVETYDGRGSVELDSTAVAPGWIGHLVDDRGAEVPGSTFVIRMVSARGAIGELVDPVGVTARAARGEAMWTAVVTRPSATP